MIGKMNYVWITGSDFSLFLFNTLYVIRLASGAKSQRFESSRRAIKAVIYQIFKALTRNWLSTDVER